MKKRVKSHVRIIIAISIVVGLGIGLWMVFFGGPTVSQKKAHEILEQDCDYKYFYNQLDNDEKIAYEKIFYTMVNFSKEVKIKVKDIEQLETIFESVIYDHPELYYVSNQFKYRTQGQSMIFIPNYDYKEEEVKELMGQIEEKTKDIIDKAKKKEKQIDKAQLIYEYIIDRVEYQKNERIDQNMLSSLIDGKSVCAGYARAYQYVLNQVGVEAVYMVGTAKESTTITNKGEGHAWVMIRIDDDYYYSDPTWGDVTVDHNEHICYGYFMMNDQDMLANYQPETSYEKTKNKGDLYYKNIGCYMETYSETLVSKAIKRGLDNQTRVAEIKCANDNIYQVLKKNIQSTYLGYNLLRAQGCWNNMCTYSYNDELKLIELFY